MVIWLVVSAFVSGQGLKELQTTFDKHVAEAQLVRDGKIAKLRADYAVQLEAYLKKVQADGNLMESLIARAEVDRAKTVTGPMPDLGADASETVKGYRGKLAAAEGVEQKVYGDRITKLVDVMDGALKAREVEWTKAGKFDEAIEVKDMREKLKKSYQVEVAQTVVSNPADVPSSTNVPDAGGDWKSLFEKQFEVVQKYDNYPAVYLKEDLSDAFPTLRERLTRAGEPKVSKAVFAHSHSVIRFKLSKDVTQLKGRAVVGNPHGWLTFRIRAGKAVVYEQNAGWDSQIDVNVKFPATREIELEVDPLGSNHNDLAAWVDFQVQ